jgi:hypothetical protein
MVVIALKGEQILNGRLFFISEKNHTLSGITFTIDKTNKNILVQGKP